MPCKFYPEMAQYLEDCALYEQPWLLWECRTKHFGDSGLPGYWMPRSDHPIWNEEFEYRRRPFSINGHEFPAPLREPPPKGTPYFVPILSHEHWLGFRWEGDPFSMQHLELGLVHLTKEAAAAHSEALLSFTATKTEESV